MDPTQFVNRSKRLVSIGRKKCSKNVIAVLQNTTVTSWIYAYEPESKQQLTIWVFQDEPNPIKVARSRSASKQMIACFFGKTGHVASVLPEQCRTVNSKWYTTICLLVVLQEIRNTKKSGKPRNQETTMRALTHRLTQLHF